MFYAISFYKIVFMLIQLEGCTSKLTGFALIEDYAKRHKLILAPINDETKASLTDFFGHYYAHSQTFTDNDVITELSNLMESSKVELINQIDFGQAQSVYIEGEGSDLTHLLPAVKASILSKLVYLDLKEHEKVDPLVMWLMKHYEMNLSESKETFLDCDVSIVFGDYEVFNELCMYKSLYLIADKADFVKTGVVAAARRKLIGFEKNGFFSLASWVAASGNDQILLVDYQHNKEIKFGSNLISVDDLALNQDVNFSVDYHQKRAHFKSWLDEVKSNPKGYSTLAQLAPFNKTAQLIVDTAGESEIVEISHNDFDQMGRITHSKKIKRVSHEKAFELKSRFALKKGDLMVSVKASIGSVAMIDQDIEDNLLPAMSMVAMRPTKASLTVFDAQMNELVELPTYYLYLYLRSEKVQAYLKSLDTGAKTEMIRISDLKDLPVPHIGKDEAEKLLEQLSAKREKIEKIVQLMGEIEGV